MPDRSTFITNDDKDALIARLIERSEWMMEESRNMRRVIERLDQTLDHLGEAVGKQASAIEAISNTLTDITGLKQQIQGLSAQVAAMNGPVQFWAAVRDRIALYALMMLAAAALSAWGVQHLMELFAK